MPNVHTRLTREYEATPHSKANQKKEYQKAYHKKYAASLHGKDKINAYKASLHGKDKTNAYKAEYRKRKSQKIEGQKTLMQAWEKARAPSDSAVLPPRSILQGVALASPDSTESQVEETEDPWELQRLHDAWLAKEFFSHNKYNVFFTTGFLVVQIAERRSIASGT